MKNLKVSSRINPKKDRLPHPSDIGDTQVVQGGSMPIKKLFAKIRKGEQIPSIADNRMTYTEEEIKDTSNFIDVSSMDKLEKIDLLRETQKNVKIGKKKVDMINTAIKENKRNIKAAKDNEKASKEAK